MAEQQEKLRGLYKNNNQLELKQSERRVHLLLSQKEKRQVTSDTIRNLVKFVHNYRQQQFYHRKLFKENRLQLSEWMMERPDDLENWFLVPCPKGRRCLVVAHKGRTEAIGKNGCLMLGFRSMLPGDKYKFDTDTTILDTFYDSYRQCFYILDVLLYGGRDFTQCDTDFRFYWLQSKVEEDSLSKKSKNNPYPFVNLPYYSFTDPLAIDECLGKYPMWPDNSPELDGLLFFHKESYYVHGTTPLVLWLFPFMVPDVLGIRSVNERYFEAKPVDYLDYKTYIDDFDRKMRQKKEKSKRKKERKTMETEEGSKEEQNDEPKEESVPETEMEAQDEDSENYDRIRMQTEMFLLETAED